MAISDKDLKILWARSGGKCAVCRKDVTLDATAGAKNVGEMAHIVGEKMTSPRGESAMPLENRDAYHNRIVLCQHDHGIVDADVDAYPVEVLHQIKSDHEEWVRERLGSTEEPSDIVYAMCVDAIETHMELDSWAQFSQNAMSEAVHLRFLDGRGQLNAVLAGAVFLGERPELERAIAAVITSFSDFLVHFESRSTLRGQTLIVDKSWKKHHWGDVEAFHREADRDQYWAMRMFGLLCDLTVKLNSFAALVRSQLNPYYRLDGNFVLVDEMGAWHGGVATVFVPDEEFVSGLLEDYPELSADL